MAFGSLVIDEVFEVGGFRIIDGANGLFVSPPQHKGKDKEGNDTWYDDARFIGETREDVRDEIYKSFIEAYSPGASATSSQASAARAQAGASEGSGSGRRPLW